MGIPQVHVLRMYVQGVHEALVRGAVQGGEGGGGGGEGADGSRRHGGDGSGAVGAVREEGKEGKEEKETKTGTTGGPNGNVAAHTSAGTSSALPPRSASVSSSQLRSESVSVLPMCGALAGFVPILAQVMLRASKIVLGSSVAQPGNTSQYVDE